MAPDRLRFLSFLDICHIHDLPRITQKFDPLDPSRFFAVLIGFNKQTQAMHILELHESITEGMSIYNGLMPVIAEPEWNRLSLLNRLFCQIKGLCPVCLRRLRESNRRAIYIELDSERPRSFRRCLDDDRVNLHRYGTEHVPFCIEGQGRRCLKGKWIRSCSSVSDSK